MSPILVLLIQTGHSAVVLPSCPVGQRTHRLPTSPWHKTNLSAFICVGGSPLKALLQDWRSAISTISFWQAAGGVTWDQLYTDGTWQACRSVMSAIAGGKMVAGWTGKQRCNSWIKHTNPCMYTGHWHRSAQTQKFINSKIKWRHKQNVKLRNRQLKKDQKTVEPP